MFITDPDHIEISNLNRQFLFGPLDLGKSKSIVAAQKAKMINPDVDVIAHEHKLGNETLNIYNTKFFKQFGMAVSALDNVGGRVFLDALCVKYDKPFVDSGTLGVKGNVQAIIPNLTESYASLQDPQEQNIPACTLKAFPTKYEHVVQYARDTFEGFFNRIQSNLIKARDSPDSLKTMVSTDLVTMYDDIKTIVRGCENFKYCINIAYKKWHVLFRDIINQIIRQYPQDCKDDDGLQFWTAGKTFPKAFDFDSKNEHDLDFVISFSNIWADALGIEKKKRYPPQSKERYIKFLEKLEIPKETQCKEISNMRPETKDEKKRKVKKEKPELTTDEIIQKIKKLIEDKKEFLVKVNPITFEKDNDDNQHIDFITALSQKRAKNYNIESKDRLETKSIAGKIIPAIATTTSVVSGLVSLELHKIVYGILDKKYNSLSRYRSGSFNLAVQSFGFGEPNRPKTYTINDKQYSIWTKIKSSPDDTLELLIEQWSDVVVKRDPERRIMTVDFIANEDGIIYSSIMDGEEEEKKSKKDNPKYKKLREFAKDGTKGNYYFILSLEDITETEDDKEELPISFDSKLKNKPQDSETMIHLMITL